MGEMSTVDSLARLRAQEAGDGSQGRLQNVVVANICG